MPHFAYPNILTREQQFIGCGRYAVASGEDLTADWQPCRDVPPTPNSQTLKRAVYLYDPKSWGAAGKLFHRQDEEHCTYQGDSLDLAWFLAHINCSHQLKCKAKSDIWCTGVISVENNGILLLDVNQKGFALKLTAFLDSANSDLLFIAPLANVSRCEQTLRNHGVSIHTLSLQSSSAIFSVRRKTVIAVPGNHLETLVAVLFEGIRPRRSRLRLLFLVLLFSITLLISEQVLFPIQPEAPGKKATPQKPATPGFSTSQPQMTTDQPDTDSPLPHEPEVVPAIKKGNFAPLITLLDQMKTRQKELTEADRALLRRLSTSHGIIPLILWKKEGEAKEQTTAMLAESRPPELSSRDLYRFVINCRTPAGKLYLYLFQVDSRGQLTRLYPDPDHNGRNPVQPWQWPLVIPNQNQTSIHLDDLTGDDPEKIREQIYLLITPWQATDIEELYRTWLEKPTDSDRKGAILCAITRRAELDQAAIVSLRWDFFHVRPQQPGKTSVPPDTRAEPLETSETTDEDEKILSPPLSTDDNKGEETQLDGDRHEKRDSLYRSTSPRRRSRPRGVSFEKYPLRGDACTADGTAQLYQQWAQPLYLQYADQTRHQP